jgi:hypothetical protein
MSKKETAFRDLTAGAESARLANVREPHAQLPVPTPEERARLFLRAVHGELDFTSSQHAEIEVETRRVAPKQPHSAACI